MATLSICLPSRNEQFLARTVQDLLENIRGDTEIIPVIDGQADGPDVPIDPRVRLIRLDKPIGQRAAQNLAVRNSTAKYVMKLDAHCSVAPGFDVALMAAMQDDITLVPMMKNLHVFDWVCQFCGVHTYQDKKPDNCKECFSGPDQIQMEIVWKAKNNPTSSAYRFNKELRFKYFPELRERQGRTGLQPSLSLQGSCFMATRENYWAKELCDETWGSWGQQGTEVALKTWLSGGRVMCCMDTWYSHMFRTHEGFSHPYPGVAESQRRARDICKDIFLNDKWPKQIYPLAWLLEKFWEPLSRVGASKDEPEELMWREPDLRALKARPFVVKATGAAYVRIPTKGMIYYTDNELPEAIAAPVRERLIAISADKGLPIVTAALKRRLSFGVKNIYFPSLKRGPAAMFKQILGALEHSTADIIFFCEHDVLYHPSHFDFTPPDAGKVYYNLNLWQVRASDGHAVYWDAKRVSQLCGYRSVLIEHYRKRLEIVERDGFTMAMGYEPGSHNRKERVDDLQSDVWRSAEPNIDIKHGGNLSPSKWSLADFRTPPTGWREAEKVPGWDSRLETVWQR